MHTSLIVYKLKMIVWFLWQLYLQKIDYEWHQEEEQMNHANTGHIKHNNKTVQMSSRKHACVILAPLNPTFI